MTKVTANLVMSLDGFIAGPNNNPGNPLGDGGIRLHHWVFPLASWRARRHGLSGGETGPSSDIMAEAFETLGAVVMGRRMFDEGEGPWGNNPPFRVPVFVLTHHHREVIVREGGTSFTFVTDGIESALKQARVAAGNKEVGIGGGAYTVQQYLRAGLLDELLVHVTPVLLRAGTRLLDGLEDARVELEQTQVVEGRGVTHLRYRAIR